MDHTERFEREFLAHFDTEESALIYVMTAPPKTAFRYLVLDRVKSFKGMTLWLECFPEDLRHFGHIATPDIDMVTQELHLFYIAMINPGTLIAVLNRLQDETYIQRIAIESTRYRRIALRYIRNPSRALFLATRYPEHRELLINAVKNDRDARRDWANIWPEDALQLML